MRALLFASVSAMVALTGCSTTTVDIQLMSMPGVEISKDGHGNAFIESVDLQRPGTQVQKDDLPLCLAQNVTHSSVTLSGTASTYISPFTGAVYTASQSSDVAGGQSIQYVSDDGSEAVATGVEEYEISSMGIPVRKYMRFTLASQVSDSEVKYHFSNLEQAQANAGAAQNLGFTKVGAWSAASPDKAFDALVDVADRIDRCLSTR